MLRLSEVYQYRVPNTVCLHSMEHQIGDLSRKLVCPCAVVVPGTWLCLVNPSRKWLRFKPRRACQDTRTVPVRAGVKKGPRQLVLSCKTPAFLSLPKPYFIVFESQKKTPCKARGCSSTPDLTLFGLRNHIFPAPFCNEDQTRFKLRDQLATPHGACPVCSSTKLRSSSHGNMADYC